MALSGDSALIGAPHKTVGGHSQAGAVYVDVLSSAPSVSLRASSHSVRVHKKVTFTGVVRHYLSGSHTVLIERKFKGKLMRLKSLTSTKTGSFKWTWKAAKTGKWVLVATYEVGATRYSSKPITVTVHE